MVRRLHHLDYYLERSRLNVIATITLLVVAIIFKKHLCCCVIVMIIGNGVMKDLSPMSRHAQGCNTWLLDGPDNQSKLLF